MCRTVHALNVTEYLIIVDTSRCANDPVYKASPYLLMISIFSARLSDILSTFEHVNVTGRKKQLVREKSL